MIFSEPAAYTSHATRRRKSCAVTVGDYRIRRAERLFGDGIVSLARR